MLWKNGLMVGPPNARGPLSSLSNEFSSANVTLLFAISSSSSGCMFAFCCFLDHNGDNRPSPTGRRVYQGLFCKENVFAALLISIKCISLTFAWRSQEYCS